MAQSNNPGLILLKGTQRIVVGGLAPWGGYEGGTNGDC
jgi:hypothetical protein